jgi:hypothetical protein
MKISPRIGLVVFSIVTLAMVAPAMANQPEMEAALRDLRAAKGHLEKAMHNKGGYRVEAMETINRAIVEVEKGIQVGKEHGY